MQKPSEDGSPWVSLPLEPEEAEDLLRLKAKHCSWSLHKFKTSDRRYEVRLRARARGAVVGPEDCLAEGLGKKDGLSGGGSLPH